VGYQHELNGIGGFHYLVVIPTTWEIHFIFAGLASAVFFTNTRLSRYKYFLWFLA
jgi:hypothetical protein